MNTIGIIVTVCVILILFTYALMMIKFFTDDLRAALSFSETKRVGCHKVDFTTIFQLGFGIAFQKSVVV